MALIWIGCVMFHNEEFPKFQIPNVKITNHLSPLFLWKTFHSFNKNTAVKMTLAYQLHTQVTVACHKWNSVNLNLRQNSIVNKVVPIFGCQSLHVPWKENRLHFIHKLNKYQLRLYRARQKFIQSNLLLNVYIFFRLYHVYLF